MKKVAIYTTPICVYCQMTKEFFKQNNVAYEEHDVMTDVTRREEMVNKSGQMGVPVISVVDEKGEENIVIGFDQGSLVTLLGL
jgi:glutaredoxin-like YruB-family protein